MLITVLVVLVREKSARGRHFKEATNVCVMFLTSVALAASFITVLSAHVAYL